MNSEQQERQIRTPGDLVFEGGLQETVEILPSVDQLTPEGREQGVIARVGRDRIERRVREGQPPAPRGVVNGERLRDDALTAATYKIAGYFTAVIVFIALVIATGWVVALNIGV